MKKLNGKVPISFWPKRDANGIQSNGFGVGGCYGPKSGKLRQLVASDSSVAGSYGPRADFTSV
jgi:hypothetical protein